MLWPDVPDVEDDEPLWLGIEDEPLFIEQPLDSGLLLPLP
jgi:hypothetical protein